MLRSVVTLVVCCGISAPLLGAGGACGGGAGGGFGGFGGGSSYPFELPKVEEDVDVAGRDIEAESNQMGLFGLRELGERSAGALCWGRYRGDASAHRAPADNDRALAETLAAEAGVLYARRVSTSGAITGVKAAYGTRQNIWADQTKVRYFLKVAGSNWLCFEARATGKSPQWQDANDLILGAKPDRSRG